MLSLKQARRMVAKSRRRVWRAVRQNRPFAPIIAGDDSLAAYYVETALPGLVPSYRGHFARLASELQRRREVCWQLLVVQAGKAWVRHRVNDENLAILPIGPGSMEVSEYEMGMGELCRVCGAEMDWIECDHCDGEGGRDNDALMEEDPLWYDGVEWEDCTECDGKGGWWQCYQDHSNVQ